MSGPHKVRRYTRHIRHCIVVSHHESDQDSDVAHDPDLLVAQLPGIPVIAKMPTLPTYALAPLLLRSFSSFYPIATDLSADFLADPLLTRC